MGDFLKRLGIGREKGEKRFHFDPWRLRPRRYWDMSESTFIKVDEEGQVVETGNPIWGENGRVHFIGIPWLSDKEETDRVVDAILTHKVNASEISVGITLTIIFESKEFDFQELYDKVVAQGFRHIDDWITALFKDAAEQDEAVQEAFQRYAEHERPVLFIEELGMALRGLDFSGQPLKNIKQVKAQAGLNTVTATMRATYDGTA